MQQQVSKEPVVVLWDGAGIRQRQEHLHEQLTGERILRSSLHSESSELLRALRDIKSPQNCSVFSETLRVFSDT